MSTGEEANALRLAMQALEHEGEARERWLSETLGARPELLAEVSAIVADTEREEEDGFLEPPERGEVDDLLGEHFRRDVVGTQLGRFTVLGLLGSGGMGTVYRARSDDPEHGGEVALKVMKLDLIDHRAARRFQNEAEVLRKLDHPGIARVYEAGTQGGEGDESGPILPWIAMEYVAGARTLLEYGAALALDERVHLFQQVCAAVQHGHEQGIVHCDLKPGNVLVDEHGAPKVIDFGLSRTTEFERMSTSLKSAVGQILGTFRYMSPEQLDPDPSRVDERADVYALGVVLYELLCGAPPWALEKLPLSAALQRVLQTPPEPPEQHAPELPPTLRAVLMRALEKEPQRRQQSATELSHELSEALEGRPPRRSLWSRLLGVFG